MIAWGRMRAGYRSDGKRAWKIMLDENGAEVSRKYFLYDGDNLLCELDGQLRVMSTSTWGANGLVSRATNTYDQNGTPINGATTFYAYDERGSVAERVTDNGDGTPVVNHVAFDAWGYGTAGDCVGFGGKWGYYTDTETGLILCTHRYYDPSKQRWVTRDPIGYDGGVNLYGYGANNPLNTIDPDGLNWFGDQWDNFKSWVNRSLFGPPRSTAPTSDEPGADTWALAEEKVGADKRGVRVSAKLAETGMRAYGEAANQLAFGAALHGVSIVRRGNLLVEYGKVCESTHFDAVRRELWGEIVKLKRSGEVYDHVTEVRNVMRGLRKIIKQSKGALKDPRLTYGERTIIKSQLREAQRMLRKANEIFKTGP